MVMATVASSLFSALKFAQLSATVDHALHASEEAISLATELAGSLEREDDALLLALSGDREVARASLQAEQQRGNASLDRLVKKLERGDSEERGIASELRHEIDEYRGAGARLLSLAGHPDAVARYHQTVNPHLRQTVATCARVREINFRTMARAGIQARDAASRATHIVTTITAAAFVLGTLVTVWLARSIIMPVRDLTASVDAVRKGDFDRRVAPSAVDELGKLADGFNRMAETVGEYRRSSLGELLAAKTTLEATLNALPDAVIVIAPDGSVGAVNAPARAILASADVPHAGCLRELPLRPAHLQAVKAALMGRPCRPSRADFSHVLVLTIGGQLKRFLVAAVPIPDFVPRQYGAVIVLDDVTEIARLDELRTELIGVASHELKTPLTALRMNLMLLVEELQQIGPRQREMLSAALEGSEELGSTIDELLDMTRIEADQLRLNMAPVDLFALLRQVQARLQPRLDDARISLEIVATFKTAIVHGDAARLASVLTNVLVNSLKYSPQGEKVIVSITAGAIASGQNAGVPQLSGVQLTVTDAGPGIPADFRERVFEKFFRVEHHLGSDSNGVRGTGIGLYLCREIIRAHGGTIWCEPGENGVGTRVAFILPVAREMPEAATGISQPRHP